MSERQTYVTPRLIRFGRIEDLTQGSNALTLNIVDVLSIQT